MIKPDGVQRGLVGKIISRFEEKGYKLIALKMMRPTREQFERHYGDLAARSFFPSLVAYMVRASMHACMHACLVCMGRAFACRQGRVPLPVWVGLGPSTPPPLPPFLAHPRTH
jgi:hypothetical protein